MIGVGEQETNAQVFAEIALGQPFDCGLRAHGHEDRCFDGSVRGVEQAGARTCCAALGHYFKGNLGQLRLYAGRSSGLVELVLDIGNPFAEIGDFAILGLESGVDFLSPVVDAGTPTAARLPHPRLTVQARGLIIEATVNFRESVS